MVGNKIERCARRERFGHGGERLAHLIDRKIWAIATQAGEGVQAVGLRAINCALQYIIEWAAKDLRAMLLRQFGDEGVFGFVRGGDDQRQAQGAGAFEDVCQQRAAGKIHQRLAGQAAGAHAREHHDGEF